MYNLTQTLCPCLSVSSRGIYHQQQDSTFTFERRRNKPVKYDRNLIATTVRAMKRIGEIKSRREEIFHRRRMVAAKEKHRTFKKKRTEKKKAEIALIHENNAVQNRLLQQSQEGVTDIARRSRMET